MVEIIEAKTKKQLRAFRDFPDKLYAGYKNYIPDLKADEFSMYFPETNAAFDYCEAKFFLALKDGEIVGRVCAINSKESNKKWGTKSIRFSRIDFIDDKQVSAALIGAVESWAKEIGLTEIHGPLGFSDLDKEGLQIEGFEYDGLSFTINNYPYYKEHLEALGFTKATDWVENRIMVPKKDDPIVAKMDRMSELVLKRTKLKLLEIKRMSQASRIIMQIFDLLNECYKDLYGVVPYNKHQALEYFNRFKPLLNPKYAKFITDSDGKLVGFGLAAPSLNKCLRQNKGRLFPFGFIPILKAINNVEILDLYLIAVHPKYQSSGLPAVLMNAVMKSAVEGGVKFAETGPELETNDKIQSLWKYFEVIPTKRRRCFIKEID